MSSPILAATLMGLAVPAFAQAGPATTSPATTSPEAAVAAGQTVYDTAGVVVGKVDKVEGGVAVLATGKNTIGLPLTSFAMGPNGPVISMTRDQVDAAAGAAAAEAATKKAASFVAGAKVKDTAGVAVGTIRSVDGQFVLLDTSKVQVKLPLAAFAVQGDSLVVSMSKVQIEAAAAGATPASR